MPSSDARRHQPKIRQSIRTQLLVLLLGLVTISVLTVGYLGVNSTQSVGKSAQQISAEALRTQAEEYLRQVTVGDAQRNDLVLKRAQRDAENVAQYATSIFEKPDTFTGAAYWRAEDHMFVGPDGQYLNDETDVSSAFAPNFVDIDEELLTVLELSAYSDFILVPTYESDPNTVAIYLSTDRETTRYHPNINLGMVVPPDFQITQRPWYISANPENNPERAVIWSPVYVDATGKGLMVTTAAPIYISGNEFIGAIGIDLTLDDIRASVEAARSLSGGYSLLIDDTGYAIALPERGYQDILGRPAESGEVGADLSEVTTEFAPILAEMMAGSTGFDTLEVGGRELLVAYAPLESTGWSLANVIEAGQVLQAMITLQEELQAETGSVATARILLVSAGILIAVVVFGLVLTNRLTDPIQRLATAAQQIGAGQWDAPLPEAGDDEMGVLSEAFATMTTQVRASMQDLEQRVAERTHDLERQTVQMQAAAEVAREATAIRDVNQLLDETMHLISERFGFYHAGVFLVDDRREYAVLQAASSEGGRRMLERGHKLAVGKVGMVGYVTSTGKHRITLDVGEDAAHFVNPDLPETRSEITLPLRVRGEVIGALDVQSTEEAAFSDQDVATLGTMADQLAIAIDNARLFQEAQDRLRELNLLYGEYSATAWAQLSPLEHPLGYVYDRIDVTPMGQLSVPALDLALQRGEPVALVEPEVAEAALGMPLKLHNQIIGALGIQETDEAREWSSDEVALVEAVSDQVALALESARLFEETRRRAEEQQGLTRIAALASSTLDLDELLAHLVDETVQLLGAKSGVLLVLDEDEKALVGRYLSREARLRLGSMEWHVPLDSPGFEQSIFSRGGAYYTNQAQADPNILPAYRPYVKAIGADNFCGIALRVRDQSIGELYVANRPGGFGQEEARLLRTVTGYIANAVENARLFEQTQEQVEHLSALHRAVQSVSATLDPDVLTGKLVDEARRLIGADYGVLAVLDPATGGIQYFKTAGIEEGGCPLTELPRGRGLLKLVLEGQTVRVDDIREHPSYGNYLPAGHLPIVSFMGLPLVYQNQVRGLLAVSNQANRPTFDQGDETLLGTFATQATVTLENARLFEQTQRRARREQLAREIAGKIQAAGDVEAVLQTAVRELGRALGTPRSFVHLGTPGQSDAPPSRAPSAQKSPDVK